MIMRDTQTRRAEPGPPDTGQGQEAAGQRPEELRSS